MENDLHIARRFRALEPFLDERLRRLVAAAEAQSLEGRTISRVAKATGVSRRAITQGLKELNDPVVSPPQAGRIRKPGGGRKLTIHTDFTLQSDLERLIDPVTRGDTESPLRWTCKSVRELAGQLCEQGHQTSHRMVAQLLHEMGYSLQANAKTVEGGSLPDRNAQFEHIYDAVQTQMTEGQPVISIDTKKKALVGDFKNGGHEPYGAYDVAHNMDWVSVGVDHVTAGFAVESIRRWWRFMGEPLYPGAARVLIVADGGGSNASRVRRWIVELQKLADDLGVVMDVCHLPPGTSKWNKIEHRLFSFISQNWRGKPPVSHEVIVNLIAATTHKDVINVRCELDMNTYPACIKISDAALGQVNLVRNEFNGDWNYSILPHGHEMP